LQELDELFEQSADADAGVAEVKDEEVGSLFGLNDGNFP